MPDFLTSPFANGPDISPKDTALRLLLALLLGYVVSWIYRLTRSKSEIAPTFPTTLVLLSVLIAMVTQVIGDNIARAFSLVGALSIVRFRTVVRDTQDTAYVIFAVVVGMAVGAKNPWVGFIGLAVMGLAAFFMMSRPRINSVDQPELLLSLRVAVGVDVEKLLAHIFDLHLQERELVSISTAKQGLSLEIIYQTHLRPDGSPDELIKALNRIEGVQSVQLHQRGFDME